MLSVILLFLWWFVWWFYVTARRLALLKTLAAMRNVARVCAVMARETIYAFLFFPVLATPRGLRILWTSHKGRETKHVKKRLDWPFKLRRQFYRLLVVFLAACFHDAAACGHKTRLHHPTRVAQAWLLLLLHCGVYADNRRATGRRATCCTVWSVAPQEVHGGRAARPVYSVLLPCNVLY